MRSFSTSFAWEFPNLVVANLAVCTFYAEALFFHLLRPFVLFCALLRYVADIYAPLRSLVGASQMTTKFLTIKFAKFPNFIVMELPRKNSVFGKFSVNFPLPNPLQNVNFINIVVSASLKFLRPTAFRTTAFGNCRFKGDSCREDASVRALSSRTDKIALTTCLKHISGAFLWLVRCLESRFGVRSDSNHHRSQRFQIARFKSRGQKPFESLIRFY